MKNRETPRDLTRNNIVEVELPQDVHHFKLPSVLAVSKLLAAVDQDALAAVMALATMFKKGDAKTGLVLLQRSGTQGLSLVGALVGISWFHKHKDLEATRGDDILAYGEAVYEELHEAGYDSVKMMLLAGVLAKEIQAAQKFDQEVAERLGFSFPTEEQTS